MNQNTINRKEFLSKLSSGAVLALTYACLSGCTKMENPAAPVSLNTDAPSGIVDFYLDLNAPQNAPLLNNGGYVIVNNDTVVAKDDLGNYIAATRLCSHEPFKEIIWSTVSNEWLCTEHGATFDKLGVGTQTFNNNGAAGLTIYNTALNGTTLHVYE